MTADDSDEEGNVIQLNGLSLKGEGIFTRGSRFNVCKEANIDSTTKPEVRISSFCLRGWVGVGMMFSDSPWVSLRQRQGEGVESRGEGTGKLVEHRAAFPRA